MDQTARDPRQINAMMIEKIRSAPLQPYQEGSYALRVIEVRGRRTGQLRQVPIAITQINGARYLTAPHRRRQWVQNLLAVGECRVLGEEGPLHPVLVEGMEAATVIKTYLTVLNMPFATAEFAVDPTAPVEEIAEHTSETAVLRLEPVDALT